MANQTVKRRDLESFDGTRLSYAVTGSGEIDFVLCDGIGCDGFIWRYLKPELERIGRVIHLHMRGHGESADPVEFEHTGIHHLADDWSVVLAATRRNQTVVLGHSMGVQVALELWRRHPQHVGALVLMCGSFQNPVSTFHDDRFMELALPFLRRATQAGGRPLQRIWSRLLRLPIAFHVARLTEIHPDLTRPEDFGPYLEHLARIEPGLFFRMLTGAAAHSADGYLDEIDVPTLVIAAERDRFTPPRLSIEISKRIRAAELLVLADGTHTAPIEFPVLTNTRILDFINRLG